MADEKVFRINKKMFQVQMLSAIPFVFILIGIPMLIVYTLQYLFTSITVTEKGLVYRKGWLLVTHKQIPFSNINTVDIKMGPIGRKWDYGNIKIFTGNDVEGITVQNIERPQELKRLVEAHI